MSAVKLRQQTGRTTLARGNFSEPTTHSHPGKGTPVLLADDGPGFRALLKRAMEKGGRFVVEEAKDGEEAVRLARDHHPQAVLMDLAMPRINGLEATRMIKAEQPKVRVI